MWGVGGGGTHRLCGLGGGEPRGTHLAIIIIGRLGVFCRLNRVEGSCCSVGVDMSCR